MGNITQIVDASDTDANKTVVFTYDDLYRLTVASTTAASSTPYRRTYTYNSIGNITNKSDVGNYTYNDDGYNNPHATDNVAGTNYSYDNNGNVTAIGSDTYDWDYRNRLNEALISGATTTYGYDHNNIRVKKAIEGGETTVYPNKMYNTTGATTTLHVFDDNGGLIATIEGDGTSTTTHYIHVDHLGGTNVVTDETQAVVQTLDYYPFGDERIETGTFSEQRQFTGHEKDDETDLTYAKARYYAQDQGKWLSQDPASRDNPGQFLADPQQLNTYSYARNNPLILFDPTGEVAVMFSGFGGSQADLQGIRSMTENTASQFGISNPETHILRFQDVDIAKQLVLDARSRAAENGNTEPVVIVGHSLGGNAALKLSAALQAEGVNVDSLLLLEAVSGRSVPGNVKGGYNFSSDDGFAIGRNNFGGLTNVHIGGLSHTSIDTPGVSNLVTGTVASQIARQHRAAQLSNLQQQVNNVRSQVDNLSSAVNNRSKDEE